MVGFCCLFQADPVLYDGFINLKLPHLAVSEQQIIAGVRHLLLTGCAAGDSSSEGVAVTVVLRARLADANLHCESVGEAGRGEGADVAVPDAARVPVENGVTEEFQSLLGDQHDWLPVSGGVLTEHGLVLSKVSDGGDEIIIRRLGLDNLGTLLLDDMLDQFVKSSLPATRPPVVCRTLHGPKHAARLVVWQSDHQVLEHTAGQVVPTLHGSVLQCGAQELLSYQ